MKNMEFIIQYDISRDDDFSLKDILSPEQISELQIITLKIEIDRCSRMLITEVNGREVSNGGTCGFCGADRGNGWHCGNCGGT